MNAVLADLLADVEQKRAVAREAFERADRVDNGTGSDDVEFLHLALEVARNDHRNAAIAAAEHVLAAQADGTATPDEIRAATTALLRWQTTIPELRRLLVPPGEYETREHRHLAAVPDVPAPSVRSTIEAMMVADDDLDSIPDPVPLVGDLFAMDSIAAIYGRSGKGKSFLAILLAYSVALGKDFQGRITKRGPVLYVAAEGQGGLKRRRAAYREHYGVTESAPVTWLAGVVNMLSPTSVAMLAEVVAEMTPRPKLIVLDTLARLSPGGKEDAEDIGQFINAMDALRAATGACVVAVHHAGKDEGRGARGHSSFEAAMDTMIEVGSTSPGKITALVTKQKDFCSGGESMDFTLEPAAGSVTAVPAFGLTHEAEMTGAKATAYQSFLDIVLDDGVTATEWRKSTDLAERTFYNVRAALIDEGKIEKRGQRYFLAQKPIEELMPDAV